MMEDAGLEIGDLLQGLAAETAAIWQEQDNNA